MSNFSRMRRCAAVLLAASTLLLCNVAQARAPAARGLTAQRAAAVDAAVTAEMLKESIVGMAIGVIEHDRIVYLKGYGEADRSRHLPVTTQSMFRWASVSKPLTAIAAMQLWEQGKLDLEGDVRSYVPEFPDKGVRITPHELLDHQGGIVHYANGPVIRSMRKYPMPHPYVDVVNALDWFAASPLVAPPGTKYSYSTYGFVLLSAVVQRAGRKPYIDQVRERIIQPLGLVTLQSDYQWKAIPNRVKGYRKNDGAIVDSQDSDVSWKLGGGGFISDIEDFTKFALALIDRRLMGAQTEAKMWTAQQTADGQTTEYGLGFEISDKGGRLRVAHGGSQPKTRTRLVIYPRDKSGVVVMTNCEWVDPGKFTTLIYATLQASAAD